MARKWNALRTRLRKTNYDLNFTPYQAWRREARRTLQDAQDVPPDLGTLEDRSRAVAVEALELPEGVATHPILGPYLAVVEWQQDGTAHIHLATDRPVPHAVVSEAWAQLGGGFIYTSRHRNAPTLRGAEDVGRELGKYLTKAAGEPTAPWDTWKCREERGYRKTPWRRYWCSRAVGRTIRDLLHAPVVTVDAEAPEEAEGPNWAVVLPAPLLEGGEAIPFSLQNRGPCVPECEGHQLPEWGPCHHEVPGGRCECGPPLKATDPAAYHAGGEGLEDCEACLRDGPVGLPELVDVRDGRIYLRPDHPESVSREEWTRMMAEFEAYLRERGISP